MSVQKIIHSNFDELVLRSEKPVLLDFHAPWCGPCRMMGPVLEEIAAQRPDVLVGKVNVDEETALARRFGVMSIPMLAVIRGGEVVSAATGARPKSAVLAML